MKSLPLSERKESDPNTFAWATLLLFYVIGLIRCVDWCIIGALLTPIKNELQLPDEQLGQVGAVFFVASSFTSPIFGYLGDRFPRKPLMLVALTVWNVAAVGCGLTSSLTILLVGRALVGLGQGCYETLQPGWLGDTFKPRWRSLISAKGSSCSRYSSPVCALDQSTRC
jgi:MFS family permease